MRAPPAEFSNIATEQRAWAAVDSLEFFTHNRASEEALYPSEKVFLPDALRTAKTVLDVGCACGGFSRIMRQYNSSIHYTGIDIVEEMIERARTLHPQEEFFVGAGHSLPFESKSFDLVHCSGVVHLNSQYEIMIAEMWRVSKQACLFDMRLTEDNTQTGTFSVNFEGKEKGGELPYHIVNLAEVRAMVNSFSEPPRSVKLNGYRHCISPQARVQGPGSVIMAFLLLERGSADPGWHISIEGTSA